MRQVHNRASTRAGGGKNLEGKAHSLILEQSLVILGVAGAKSLP
jgi:hypothetical protein